MDINTVMRDRAETAFKLADKRRYVEAAEMFKHIGEAYSRHYFRLVGEARKAALAANKPRIVWMHPPFNNTYRWVVRYGDQTGPQYFSVDRPMDERIRYGHICEIVMAMNRGITLDDRYSVASKPS